MLIFTLLLIILNFSHHISETGSVKYLLQEANSCQEKDDFFTCVCNSDGWNKIQLDPCWLLSRRAKISIGRKIMRRCNQSREKAATSVGPMISKTADERWNLCPFDCKSLIWNLCPFDVPRQKILIVNHWFAGKVSRVFWRQLKVPPWKYHHLSNRWFLGKVKRNLTF